MRSDLDSKSSFSVCTSTVLVMRGVRELAVEALDMRRINSVIFLFNSDFSRSNSSRSFRFKSVFSLSNYSISLRFNSIFSWSKSSLNSSITFSKFIIYSSYCCLIFSISCYTSSPSESSSANSKFLCGFEPFFIGGGLNISDSDSSSCSSTSASSLSSS